MGLPFAVLAIVFMVVWCKKKIKQQPLILLFLTGYSAALLLLAVWGIWQHGFISFWDAGIMK
jgi:hypothetical protein